MSARAFLDAMRQDAAYAVRTLRRAPGGAALLATYLPARRAARTDPMVAMRAE